MKGKMLPLQVIRVVVGKWGPVSIAQRGISTSRVAYGSSSVSSDAASFVKMLRKDGVLMGVLVTFACVFGYSQYSVS